MKKKNQVLSFYEDNQLNKDNKELNTSKSKKKEKYFKVSEIVFMSIMALSALLTCGIMPVVAPLLTKIFGIAHLVTSFQITLFLSIGLYRVRKPFAFIIMTIIMSSVMIIMAWPMFLGFVIPAICLELLNYIFFKGYKKTEIIFLTVSLFMPFSLPFNYLLNIIINTETSNSQAKTIYSWIAIVMSIAVIAVSLLGTSIGILIAREIGKNRKVKKHDK